MIMTRCSNSATHTYYYISQNAQRDWSILRAGRISLYDPLNFN